MHKPHGSHHMMSCVGVLLFRGLPDTAMPLPHSSPPHHPTPSPHHPTPSPHHPTLSPPKTAAPNFITLTSFRGILGNVNSVVKLAISFGASGHLSPWSLQASGMGGTKGKVAVPKVTVTLLVISLIVSSAEQERLSVSSCLLEHTPISEQNE